MSDAEALLVLNAIPGFGNARIRKLIEFYGSSSRVLSLSSHQFRSDRTLPDDLIRPFERFPRDEFLRQECRLMREHGVSVCVLSDESYPSMLRCIPDAPVVLYIQGRIPLEMPMVAIVGSRRASVYGCQVAEMFAARLAELGIVVVSGLARGIDTAAHQGCLRVRGSTVAVLGCGLNHVYPKDNARLMKSILSSGAVISEFPMDMPPLAFNFPRRNRIVSGLSLGVVVVEAARKSGALITADFALEQGKDVFAVPGPIGSPFSQGTHELIKNGAKLITGVEDVLDELKISLKEFVAKPVDEVSSLIYKEEVRPADSAPLPISDEEAVIVKCLGSGFEHVDRIAEITGLAASQANMLLLQLEIKGLVQQKPGKFFKCVVRSP